MGTQEAAGGVSDRPADDRFRDSVAGRICDQRKRTFRCITSDLVETHRFPTGLPDCFKLSVTKFYGKHSIDI